MSAILIPLLLWPFLVALWKARVLIAAFGFGIWGWLWLCRHYPRTAFVIWGALRGLFR